MGAPGQPTASAWRRAAATLAGCTAVALVATGLTGGVAHAASTEIITNGTFDSGTAPWWNTSNTPIAAVDGQLCAEVPAGATNVWDASIGFSGVPLVKGAAYQLGFTARSSVPATVKANVQLNESPYTTAISASVATTEQAKQFSYEFKGNLDSDNGVLTFQLGGGSQAFTFCLDDVSLTADTSSAGKAEQLKNGDFHDGAASWYAYGTTSAAVTDGKYCAEVPGGLANVWDAGIGQNDVTFIKGAEYTLSFTASATPNAAFKATAQLAVDPYTAYFAQSIPLNGEPTKYSFTFTANQDTTQGQVGFQLGGGSQAYTVCIDDVSLVGGAAAPPYRPDTGPRVRVNQVGYLPNGPKTATLVTEATEALPWALLDGSGKTVATGESSPRGVDAASGQNVQTIDFGSFTKGGTGYTLVADGQTSYPFDITDTVYQQLRSDSLQFFYAQRSGIAIDGDLIGKQYARPAGHLGVAPNKGDTDVPCQPGVCDYRLDVRGGWYDAGDQGKYVVNGGIATYQLLSAFERTKTAASAGFGAASGDGSLRVPERANGTPDILDEARWELEFLIRMQVPAGQPLAGMAHHKVHDAAWTGLPQAPDTDPQQRELHPPSTAATLNLAAVAAQCARLYGPYDQDFAKRCLDSATTAYAAAKANPAIFASPSDGTGGGTYDDTNVSDEFYWAAAELYLTTGKQEYLDDVQASPLNTADIFGGSGFGWQGTAALGRLDLATVPNALPAAERQRIRESVVAAADRYLTTEGTQAYGLPAGSDIYFWGSNSNIINNAVVIATAFDLTGAGKYRDGALSGMDYIFGRNALNQSYVTGWGEHSSQNQHSRLFTHQADPGLPNPPAGSLAGGANSGLQDPYAESLLNGCVGQFCYVDNYQSYSTNEVAINWNSALAWMASFMADQGGAPAKVEAASCKVNFTNYGSWWGNVGFTGAVTITNTGDQPIKGWELEFAFPADQQIRESWMGKVTQSGSKITATNEFYNGMIYPGTSAMVGFNVTNPMRITMPDPELFRVNGQVCSS